MHTRILQTTTTKSSLPKKVNGAGTREERTGQSDLSGKEKNALNLNPEQQASQAVSYKAE